MYRQFFPDALDDILVKLDVQGYEDRVIRGAQNIFQRAKVCVLEVSLDPLYSRQASFKDIFLLLDSLRFRYAGNLSQIYGDDGHVVFFDAVFVKQN